LMRSEEIILSPGRPTAFSERIAARRLARDGPHLLKEFRLSRRPVCQNGTQ
jgi:hypothetical protein